MPAMLRPYGGKSPRTGEGIFIAPNAVLVGDVSLGPRASVWFNAVIRGDIDSIAVGEATNIQDGCVLHVDAGSPLTVGRHVTVGHRAVLHGCTVGDGALIGMGAVILNGAKIGEGAVIGAGAVVPQGKEIPPRVLALGTPAKVVRQLTEEEVERGIAWAEGYAKLAAGYLKGD